MEFIFVGNPLNKSCENAYFDFMLFAKVSDKAALPRVAFSSNAITKLKITLQKVSIEIVNILIHVGTL